MGKNLRTFLEEVREKDPEDFCEIRDEIDIRCEPTAWVKGFEKEGRDPIVFFPRVRGYSLPLVINLAGSRKLMALALDTPVEKLLATFGERQRQLIAPSYQEEGPVREIFQEGGEIDLSRLPIPYHHEGDSAPYITAGIVTVVDPETGMRNCSYHRLMVAGKNRLRAHTAPGRHLDNIHKMYEAKDLPLPCSIFIGHHPALGWGSMAMTPRGTDEIEVMGGMIGEPLHLLRGRKVDCVYPAEAEIALEAEILPHVREEEGPFAEFTGYAAGVRNRPVFQVRALSMRRDAIYQDVAAGSHEHILLGLVPREVRYFEMARGLSSFVRAVSVPVSGAGRLHCYVALDKQNEGQVNQIGMALLAADPMLKHVVIVDCDIDILDEAQVLWAIATRVQADRDIHVIPNCSGSDLDPSSQYPPEREGMTAKMIINATAKPNLKYGAYGRRNRLPAELEKRIRERILRDFSKGARAEDTY